MKIYQSILTASFLLIMLMSTSFLLSKKSILDLNKSSPFECGFSNFSSTRLSFSIHFFMIAILFLMFDIEIAIMLPMFISWKLMKIKEWFLMSILITSIILYGLYHEWMNGVMEWSK
uniref:NADH-ubiquinone oxidoreductase chain 3 n=1 Tax=Changeondelphax velitchkovskyi TaxID=1291384 RepID=A0A343UJB4_9HEMI|nr:NADH dehydrogenase subunit 3 [Changeondelphax velitchkovskyi]AVC55492.1 NADH dehydrogenase subunit 3 [Changeondelphax velitchkovskyi]